MLDQKSYTRAKAQWDLYKETILNMMFRLTVELSSVHYFAKDSTKRKMKERQFTANVLGLYRILRVKIDRQTGVKFMNADEYVSLLEMDKINVDECNYSFEDIEAYFNRLCSLIDSLGYSRVEDTVEGLTLDDFS